MTVMTNCHSQLVIYISGIIYNYLKYEFHQRGLTTIHDTISTKRLSN